MNNPDIRHWCFRVARIFVICFIASIILGTVVRNMQSVGRYSTKNLEKITDIDFSFWSYDQRISKSNRQLEEMVPPVNETKLAEEFAVSVSASKEITVIVSQNAFKWEVVAQFDKNSPLYFQFIEAVARPVSVSKTQLLNEHGNYIGYVELDDRFLRLRLSELEIKDQSNDAYFKFISEESSLTQSDFTETAGLIKGELYLGNYADIWEKTTLIIKTDPEYKVLPSGKLPRKQSAEETIFEIPIPTDYTERHFNFEITRVSDSKAVAGKPISGFLTDMDNGIPVLQSFLIGVLYGFPFILFLLGTKNAPLSTGQAIINRFSDFSFLILILYIGLALINTLVDVTRELWLLPGLKDLWQFTGLPIEGAALLMTIFPTIIWTSIAKRWDALSEDLPAEKRIVFVEEPRPFVLSLLVFLACLFWLPVAVAVIADKQSAIELIYFTKGEVSLDVTPMAFLLAVGGYFSVLAILYEVYGRLVWLRSLLILVVLIIIAGLQQISYELNIQTAVTVLLFLPFMYACTRLGYYLITGRYYTVDYRNLTLRRRVLIFLVLTGITYFLLRRDNQDLSTFWLIANMSYAVGRLAIFAFLLVLLRILYQYSSKSASWRLPKEILNIGVILGLSFLFLPSQQWLFVLIVFVTGYHLLTKWALSDLQNKSVGEKSAESEVQEIIREKIAINEGRGALRSLKKDLLAKFGKGEISFDDYQNKTQALENTIKDHKRALDQRDFTYEDLMMLGADESPWTRAITATWYSVLFSLPWTIVTLINFKATSQPTENFEILSVLTSLVLRLLQFPLQGFLFGYFYPHWRGTDGIRKGFYYFLLFFIPATLATVITRSTAPNDLTNHLLWTLQLFIQSMLLGLIAGDYETLRRANLGWRHLIEVHNLSALTVWGSSVVVAISAAITTIIVTGASSLITMGVKALLPNLPDIPVK